MEESSEVVMSGMKLISEVETVFQKILESTTRAFREINQVATATNEQSSAAAEIAKSVESINNVTSETTIVIQQVAEATEDLNRLTENLQDLISAFKLESALRQYGQNEYFVLES
jgi:methyl-accepting chemotaxis protein